MKWSSGLIAGTLPLDHPKLSISHEAIYHYIYDKHTCKQRVLTIHLVRNHKKRFAKDYSRKYRKRHIPYRIPINERPKHIEERIQSGHWEADCMVSRQSKTAIAVIAERKSRKYILHYRFLPKKTDLAKLSSQEILVSNIF